MNAIMWDSCHCCGAVGGKVLGDAFHCDGSETMRSSWIRCRRCGTVYQDCADAGVKWEYPPENFARFDSEEYASAAQSAVRWFGNGRGKRMIDCGAGTGWLSAWVARRFEYERIVATELPRNDGCLRRARQYGVEARYIDFEETGVPDKMRSRFDVALNYELIEHVRDVPKWFGLMRMALKPGGMVRCRYASEANMILLELEASGTYPGSQLPFKAPEWRYPTLAGLLFAASRGGGLEYVEADTRHVVLRKPS